MRVAAAHAATARAALGGHGDALVVEEVPIEEGMTAFWWPQHAPEPGWPQPNPPVAEAAGQPAATLAQAYCEAGFEVEEYVYGHPALLTADLQPGRIRMIVRDGVVVDARQG